MLWTSTLALAAPLAAPANAPVVDPVRYLVACMGVLGLLAAGLFALRKLVMGAQRTRAAGRSLAVLDQLHLGGSKRLTVVRCYDRQFVLGVGDKEIALVAELDIDQAVPPLPERAAAQSQPANHLQGPSIAEEAPTGAREAFQGLMQRAQKLADTIVPPRRSKAEEPQQPLPAVPQKHASHSSPRVAQAEGEPTAEIKAKVARELLAKLGPDHELLGAVQSAASNAPGRARRKAQLPREAQPKREARAERRPDAVAQSHAQTTRTERAEPSAADEGWLG